MGKWVILIGDDRLCLDTIQAMTFADGIAIKKYGEKQLDVLFQSDHKAYVSFLFDDDGMMKNDYPPDELQKLPYPEPHFILMCYSEQKLLEKIVSAKDFPQDILIDCDGLDLGLERFIDQERLWDNGEI